MKGPLMKSVEESLGVYARTIKRKSRLALLNKGKPSGENSLNNGINKSMLLDPIATTMRSFTSTVF